MSTLHKFATAGQGLIAALLLVSNAGVAADVAPPSAKSPGVWQEHKYSFVFMGFTSTYSCDGLADKLKKLLLAAGARSDVKASPGACASGFGRPDKFARAELTFSTLAPAEAPDSAGARPVYGTWRPVKIALRSPRDLGTGDCELVEQFNHNVLPMFSTRNLQSRTTCIPHQVSGSIIDLSFESFAVAPGKPATAPSARPQA